MKRMYAICNSVKPYLGSMRVITVGKYIRDESLGQKSEEGKRNMERIVTTTDELRITLDGRVCVKFDIFNHDRTNVLQLGIVKHGGLRYIPKDSLVKKSEVRPYV